MGRKSLNLYPKNRSAKLDMKLFANPSAEYRGTPFWSWNNKLDRDQLIRQIDQFHEMGFGGFHIHSRTGLETAYLGDEYMEHVKACTDYAQSRQMLSWMYDEDRWPSGFAGGLVTKDPQYRVRHLLWTAKPYPEGPSTIIPGRSNRAENGTLVGRYEIILKDGYLKKYKRLKDKQKPAKNAIVRYAYLETSGTTSWFNNQTYVDTLSRPAIERFIETTHERFKEYVGDHFGTTSPAIFTDEPQYVKKTTLRSPDDLTDVILPWTPDLLETYQKTYKQNLLESLPELVFELPDGKPSLTRYRWHDHLAERFAHAFGDTLAMWCEKNGIALTGHMLSEASLHGQSRANGESMRALRSFQLPGIDILSDKFEFTTAKQAQSIAHQYGRQGVTSELYGVTNWDFDFAGHKRQADWQAAMGVSIRVPHLAWVSMAGESKRDYPGAIGYQSPWYREYGLVEDHCARVNVVMTRGTPRMRVAMVHPIESFWLGFGVTDQNAGSWQQQQQAFDDINNWLCYGLVDFDYLCESLLPAQSKEKQGKQFVVGRMKYDAVVVPPLRTIRSTTLKRLLSFARAGGTVIFAGSVPELIDARRSDDVRKLVKRAQVVPMARSEILRALEPFAEISAKHSDGTPASSIVHQVRDDGKVRQVFFAQTDREYGRQVALRFAGKWDITQLDTHTGEARKLASKLVDGTTELSYAFPAHGHLLVTLSARSRSQPSAKTEPKWREAARLIDPVPITLSEPNALLLDQATWQLNDGPWHAQEEILRIDNVCRPQLGLPRRGGQIAQPWTDTAEAPVVGQLKLRFQIESEVDIERPMLALEDAAQVAIELDGKRVESRVTGWWVDESIQTVELPPITRGTREIVLMIPYTRRTNLEWCYLLGDFGVALRGRHARVTAPVRTLAWGDWSTQGLPFYAGNVTYHCTIDGAGKRVAVEVPKFKNPLLTAQLNGKPAGKLAFAPFQIDLGTLDGEHKLDLTAYGNRINAFGPVHNTNEKLTWVGPGAWRSEGTGWSYEYQLKRMGILNAPILRTTE